MPDLQDLEELAADQEASPAPPWWQSEAAFARLKVAGRLVRRSLKYSPDQPRLPGGQPGGGQWTRVGEGAAEDSPTAPASTTQQVTVSDVAGEAPWSLFVNTYSGNGQLGAQLVHNRDGTATGTEWDTGGVEAWLARQTLMAPDQALIATTEFGHDGSSRISFGPAAEGNLLLTNVDGQLAFVPARLADVHQVAVEADIRLRALYPDLPPRELGTLIHQEIARQVGSWPEIGIAIYSEQGVLRRVALTGAILPEGASRFDVLEDAGGGTVCIYDPKTGESDMRTRQMLQYWTAARLFRPNATRIYVIRLRTR